MKNTISRPKYLPFALLLALIALFTTTIYTARGQGEVNIIRERPSDEYLNKTHAPPANRQMAPSNTQLNCRYGNSVLDNEGREWLETVSSGWFIDFAATNSSTSNSHYMRQIRVSQHKIDDSATTYNPDNYLQGYNLTPNLATIRALAAANPGDVWVVGNEPDRFRFQDDTHPDIYAEIYHEVYFAIKEVDPTAQLAPAGLVQVSPGRLQYLDIVYDTYLSRYGHPMPVDIWTAHVYPLPEKQESNGQDASAGVALGTDTGLAWLYPSGDASTIRSKCQNPNDNYLCFAEHDNQTVIKNQVVQMRQWMSDHGYRDTPLILTEIGILFPEFFSGTTDPFPDENGNNWTKARTADFLTKTTAYLETATDANLGYPADGNKLVQQWAWFSMLEDGVGKISNLIVDDYDSYAAGSVDALTVVGQRYRAEATSGSLTNNLFVDKLYGQSSSGAVTLTAELRNNGNTSIFTPFNVTFYSNAAKTNVIGTTTIQPVMHGCATDKHIASVTWTPPTAGQVQFWVTVDSGNAVAESSENDNGGNARLIANPASQTYLPRVGKK